MAFDYEDLIRDFGRIWPIHTSQFCDLLVTLRQTFGGDLDSMLVLAVIGTRTLAWGRIDGLSYDEVMARDRDQTELAPINLQSIADYSGIPRETVRRKVQALQRSGWVRKRDDGYLIATSQAALDLEPATEATMKYLVAIGAACAEAASGD
jgi:biotin operon repressor